MNLDTRSFALRIPIESTSSIERSIWQYSSEQHVASYKNKAIEDLLILTEAIWLSDIKDASCFLTVQDSFFLCGPSAGSNSNFALLLHEWDFGVYYSKRVSLEWSLKAREKDQQISVRYMLNYLTLKEKGTSICFA